MIKRISHPVVLYVLYFACLSYLYAVYIVDLFGYQGYVSDFNQSKLLVSILATGILINFIGIKKTPSVFMLHMMMVLIFIPSAIIYSYSNLDNGFIFLNVIAILVVMFSSRFFKINDFGLRKIRINRLLFVFAIYTALFVASIFIMGGGKFINFDILRVYDFRRDAAENLPLIYSYLIPISSKVIIPFGIVLGLMMGRGNIVFFLVLSSVMIFALTSNKAPILYPLIVIFIYKISDGLNFLRYFIFSAILMTVFSCIDFWLLSMNSDSYYGLFGSFIGRRALIVPSELNHHYYDFFDLNPMYYWADSKISLGLLESPYSLSAPFLIGEAIFGRQLASANTGWIGSGFANAGYLGVIIYSILVGVYFSILNSYERRLGFRVIVSLFVLPTMTLITSADLITMLLTHGLLLSIMLLLVMNVNNLNGMYVKC